jgi:serine/threonine-protein kinase PRP4
LDNILVSEDFSTCQVCDFGSASLVDDGGMIPTPYLVSRYYRAPEIILGAVPSYEIDLWSVGVTVAELFLGSIVFKGSSNNDMLESMMQVLGPFSPKQIKQHLLSTRTHPLPVHFENSYFLKQDVDKVSGQKVSKRVSLQDYPSRPLQSLLLKAKSASDSRIRVLQLADLLRKCLALDPHKRVDLKQAMHHEFLTKESGSDKK